MTEIKKTEMITIPAQDLVNFIDKLMKKMETVHHRKYYHDIEYGIEYDAGNIMWVVKDVDTGEDIKRDVLLGYKRSTQNE